MVPRSRGAHDAVQAAAEPPSSREFYCKDRRVNFVVKEPRNDDIYGGDETEGLQPLRNRSEAREKEQTFTFDELSGGDVVSTKFDRNNTSGFVEKTLEFLAQERRERLYEAATAERDLVAIFKVVVREKKRKKRWAEEKKEEVTSGKRGELCDQFMSLQREEH